MKAPSRRTSTLLLVFGGTLLALAPNLTSPMPDRDSGAFLYIGSRILHGEVPFRDIWDHKGPLIHYLNAVAVWLDPGGEIGIWLIEAAAILLAGRFLNRILSRSMSSTTAMAGTALFYGGLVLVLRPGNYTEEFAIVFALVALWALDPDRCPAPSAFRFAAIGVTLAAVLFLRPNLIGTHAAIVAYLAATAPGGVRPGRGARLGWIAGGAAAVILPVLGFFATQGGLAAAWDAYVRYNFIYQQAAAGSPIGAVVEGLVTLAPSGLSLLGIGMWLLLATRFGRDRITLTSGGVLSIAWIALAIELVLVAIARRGLTHYYIGWLPSLSILAAGLLSRLSGESVPVATDRSRRLGVTLLVVGCLLWPLRRALPNLVHVVTRGPRDGSALAVELQAFPGETLLMWGAESAYNYFDGRPAPTRYVYQYPLYSCGYATREMVGGLAADIKARLPLIVDTSPTNRRVPPIDPEARAEIPELEEECALSAAMIAVMDGIWSTYREVGRLPSTGWIVYAPMD